jgi:hypothetical protein
MADSNRNIVDAQANFRNLLQKTFNLMENYGNEYGHDDGRTVFFANYLQLNLWLLIQFDNFRDTVFTPNSSSVSRHIEFAPGNPERFKSQYDRINRASYCAIAMFDVENFLRDILKHLGENTNHSMYKQLLESLERRLNLTKRQSDILRAPSYVRNSLHNNGYHTKDNFEVVIRGTLYKFVTGYKVPFTGWNHLYIMFDELLDVIEFILQSADIKKLHNIAHTSETS